MLMEELDELDEFVDFTRDIFNIYKEVYLYPIALENLDNDDRNFIKILVEGLRSIGIYAGDPNFGQNITTFKIDPDIKIKELVNIINSLRGKIIIPKYQWYFSVDNNYIRIIPDHIENTFTCSYVPRIDSPL